MKYEVEYISNFNGRQTKTVDNQAQLLKLLYSINCCNGEILDIKSIKE